ncbi:unnamed protein product [Lathyrus sativus]|nr:unnamed protein product [Lathyrus sativus]
MKTRRRNYDKDRLSDLPDCLLLQILSHLNIMQAVQISILSTRWKNLWKHISVLSINYSHSFQTLESFTNFVYQFLSHRNGKTCLQALNFDCDEYIESRLLKRIMNYVFSHNVQRLDITVACNIEPFPLCSFPYHTLTSLRLFSCREFSCSNPSFPNSLKLLPALTYLCIEFFTFRDDYYAEPFSVFKSLNTLLIQFCDVFNENNFLHISSVSLVNLTIALPSHAYKFKLSTPNLSTFDFLGDPLQNLCGSTNNNCCNFSFVKHAKIALPVTGVENFPSILFNWLVELALVESLTISPRALEILNLIPESWKIDFPYLHNLKLLKIESYYPTPIPNGTWEFLLQNAPSAKKVRVIKRTT